MENISKTCYAKLVSNVFFEITVILGIAASLAIIFRILRQPPILAYILTGLIVGPLGQFELQGKEILHVMGELGITILLFLVGLDLRFKELKSVGKVALITGIAQIIFTSIIGYFICLALGFSSIASLYIGIALTFSSTIIIVKLLSDKRDLNSLYGKISIGFLLVQDFFAIIALIFLSGFTASGETTFSVVSFLLVIVKAVILFAGIIYLSKSVIPKLIDSIAHSSETLFLFSIAWALGIAAFVSSAYVGFSIEIGGFLAGLALANSSESSFIVAKVKSLRDFFITIFFVVLGMSMTINDAGLVVIPAIILGLFVLIGNPFIVMVILGLLGYKRRTSFLSGLTVAQISEFSLIVIFLGNRLGHISNEVTTLVTIVGIITFTGSTYMILNGNALYRLLDKYLKIFERKYTSEETGSIGELQNHVVLIGANRTGKSIVNMLQEEKEKVVVIDFDPDIINELKKREIPCLFGDIADIDIQERANLHSAKLVISTVDDVKDNLALIQDHKKNKKKSKIIVLSRTNKNAKTLYTAGADYVMLPNLIAGEHLAKIIKDDNFAERIEKYKVKDLFYLT